MSRPVPVRASEIVQQFCQQLDDRQPSALQEAERLVRETERQCERLQRENQELRKIQRQLEAYKDRYVDLYDFAPLGYATLDGEGFVQEINLAGAQLLGAERDALIGYALGDYVAAEDQKAFLDHVGQCLEQRREVTCELRLLAKDGRPIATQLHSIPIEGPQNELFCKTAFTDISERKKMEEAVRQSRAFLQMVIDAIPDTLLVIGRDYRISLANRAARKLAGGADPTACLTCYQLSHHRELPCEGQNEPCPLSQVIATKQPLTVLHTHYDADGNEVLVEVSAAPVFDEAGEVSHIIEACRPISDPKRIAADIAYGLRGPVSVLRQAADYLRPGVADPAKRAEYFEVIEEQIEAIDRIAADVMETAHPNQGTGSP